MIYRRPPLTGPNINEMLAALPQPEREELAMMFDLMEQGYDVGDVGTDLVRAYQHALLVRPVQKSTEDHANA